MPKEDAPSGGASWTAATPYPTDISGYAFAQDGENMYVISGSSSAGSEGLTTVRRYNARTNAWTPLADIPDIAPHAPAAFYEGKIYVCGPATDPGPFYIYDVASNSWSQGPPCPSRRFGGTAGAFNGKVFVVGGGDAAPGYTDLSIYDIATNSWSSGPPAPSPIRFAGSAQIGQFLYVIGGRVPASSANTDVSLRLDMSTNAWTVGPDFFPRRSFFALAAAGTKLFSLGGDTTGGATNDASDQVFALETNNWPDGGWVFSPPLLPSPRRAMNAGFFTTGRVGGEIWSTGGQTDLAAETLNENLFRPVSVPCQNYNMTESTGTLVPATNDTGNHCDNCMTGTAIPFPFPVRFYGTIYGSARASSNGNLQFNSANTAQANTNLPATGFNATIFAFWENLRTDLAGDGIFTATTGTAPNRVFTIEWRVANTSATGHANFEIRFFEGSDDFEILYGASAGFYNGTIGAQRDSTTLFAQYAGPGAPFPAEGTRLLFTTGCCGPIAFNGAIGSNSTGYPGSSGTQTGRLTREGDPSVCGTLKDYPGTNDTNTRASDRYTFVNNGPATCVTFDINSNCTSTGSPIFAAAYSGSFNPANLASNYRGDTGFLLTDFRSFSVDVPANGTVVLVVNEVNPGAACPSYDVVVRGVSCPLELASVVSRKTHGTRGEFDIPLPLTNPLGVECRMSPGGIHKIVFSFDSESEVTSGSALLTLGSGSAGPPSFLGKTMTVPLSGVNDHQKISLLLNAVTNSAGQLLPNTLVSMNVLLGDASGNSNVNTSDIGQVKAGSGQPLTEANFRADTTAGGIINASDISQVKANSGHTLPP